MRSWPSRMSRGSSISSSAPRACCVAIALFVAILARLADRVRGATRLGRRTLTPVLAVAMGWALVFGVTLGVRQAWPGSAVRGRHGLADRADRSGHGRGVPDRSDAVVGVRGRVAASVDDSAEEPVGAPGTAGRAGGRVRGPVAGGRLPSRGRLGRQRRADGRDAGAGLRAVPDRGRERRPDRRSRDPRRGAPIRASVQRRRCLLRRPDASRATASRRTPICSCARSTNRVPESPPAPTTSADGSSATSTRAPSSDSSACGSGSTSPGDRARTPRPRRSRCANWPARSMPPSPRSGPSHAAPTPSS